MVDNRPIDIISELLKNSGAKPLFALDRIAPSTIYDLQYRLAIIASAFDLIAKKESPDPHSINTAKLKLLQFVAIRPWLVPILKDWSAGQKDPQLTLIYSRRFRRGFLGDTMHDDIIALLIARDILARTGPRIFPSRNADFLTNLNRTIVDQNLFTTERSTLSELGEIRITNSMLEGW